MSEMKIALSQPQPNYESIPADDEVAVYAYDKFMAENSLHLSGWLPVPTIPMDCLDEHVIF